MNKDTTSELPQQDVQSVPANEPTMADRLRADAALCESGRFSGTDIMARNMRTAADALASLTAQLSEAQKQLIADQNRIEVLQKQRAELKEELAVKDIKIKRLNDSYELAYEDDPTMVFDDQLGWMHKDSLAIVNKERELLRECVAALNHWLKHHQMDIPKDRDSSDAVGEDFTSVWFDTKQLLSRAAELGVGKETK